MAKMADVITGLKKGKTFRYYKKDLTGFKQRCTLSYEEGIVHFLVMDTYPDGEDFIVKGTQTLDELLNPEEWEATGWIPIPSQQHRDP